MTTTTAIQVGADSTATIQMTHRGGLHSLGDCARYRVVTRETAALTVCA